MLSMRLKDSQRFIVLPLLIVMILFMLCTVGPICQAIHKQVAGNFVASSLHQCVRFYWFMKLRFT